MTQTKEIEMREPTDCAHCGVEATDLVPNPPGSPLGFYKTDPDGEPVLDENGHRQTTQDIGPCVCPSCALDLAEQGAWNGGAHGCPNCGAVDSEQGLNWSRHAWRFAIDPDGHMLLLCFDCAAEFPDLLTGRSLADWPSNEPTDEMEVF